MFKVFPIDRQKAEAIEQLGTKRKFWLAEHRLLFKAEERGTGEDWAEKVTCELAGRIGLPHVHYELAEEYDGTVYIQPGVICKSCSPPPLELVLGNQLMLQRDSNYPAEAGRKYKVRQHTVAAVAEVLRTLERPSQEWAAVAPQGIATALDTFVGYAMLDAWVANQDRHHENWGALLSDRLRLAPTFDHGASLARNLSDEERRERMTTKDTNYTVARFAERAQSAFYGATTDQRSLSTTEAFVGFARLAPGAAKLWLERLAQVSRDEIKSILDEVPGKRMTNISKEFTLELLTVNQQRLLRESV